DADDVAPLIHQRPARIARLHRHTDLKITRVIRRAGQRRDFPLGQPREIIQRTDLQQPKRTYFTGPAWARTPANRCRENRPSPPCRPEAPCDWPQWAAAQTARPPSTKPNHSPHPPEPL